MEPNKCIYLKNNEKNILNVFFMIFQNSMGLRKSRYDVPNGTTQGCFCFGRGKTISQVVFHCILKYIKLVKIVTI